ncbi:hypothetical protein O181_075825 [Austropuccinia psidii MF-1]|uniref:Integrase catalytic domain-containing protein n=1 Tax=Austropuccinia psidii MF-1 TaxID=1389203 RepID=A0A9Q3IEE0_9BASI|nr:hypothetical protein [Austropuccinia psidii MF-1]
MDWVTALPPGGGRSYNSFLVLVDRYSKTPIFLPFQKDYTAMDTAIIIWNKLSVSTAYHPQTDGLSERKIQTLEGMIRRFCAYGQEFKDCDGFTHHWCTLITVHELAYKTSIHSSTGKTPGMLEKARHHAVICMQDSFKYAKERWVKNHKPPDFKIGYLVLVSTLNLNNIKVPKRLKDTFAGPFMIKALHGPNAVQLELTGELMNKHPNFPVILLNPYRSSDKYLFPLRNKPQLEIPPSEEGEEKKLVKVLQEMRTRNKKERQYLLGYRNPTQEDKWLLEKNITNADKLLRRLRNERSHKE